MRTDELRNIYIKSGGKFYEIAYRVDTQEAIRVADECRRMFPGKTIFDDRHTTPRKVAGGFNCLIQSMEGIDQ